MKISLFCPSMYGGGAEKISLNLANFFATSGYETELILLKKTGPYYKYIDRSVKVKIINPFFNILIPFYLLKHRLKTRPDIILSTLKPTSIILGFCKYFSSFTSTIVLHEPSTMYGVNHMPLINRALHIMSMKLSYRNFDGIIANSQATLDDLKKYKMVNDNYTIIGNPVISQNTKSLISQNFDHEWLDDNKIKVIISVGRLDKNKDFKTLIDAFSISYKELPYLRLLILGEGSERSNLQKYIEQYKLSKVIQLFGFVDNPFPFYKKSDLFILTSLSEGFGNVIVEALVSGIYVISTKSGGPEDIITNDKFGLLTDINRPDLLADKINNFFIYKKKHVSNSESFNKFSVNIVANEYLNFFKNLLKNQKISIFSGTLGGGGAERMVLNLTNTLVERGYNVDLILVNKTGNYIDYLNKNVNIVDLKCERALFSFFPLLKYLYKQKPKMIIASMRHINLICWFAKKFSFGFSSFKLIARESNVPSLRLISPDSLSDRIVGYLTKFSYSSCDHIIAPSSGVAKDIKKFFNIKNVPITSIPNIVDFEFIEKQKLYKNENINYFININKPIILGVGRLSPVKDFGTLIKAFSLVKKEIDCRLIIIGEGTERVTLEKIIKNLDIESDVFLLGQKDNPFPYFNLASLYVLSSISESLSNTILESLSIGTNVISTNCPFGPTEILEDGKWGDLVNVGNYKQMSESIIKNLKAPKILPSKKYLINKFGKDSIVKRYIDNF